MELRLVGSFASPTTELLAASMSVQYREAPVRYSIFLLSEKHP